jgi:hypothetical protein
VDTTEKSSRLCIAHEEENIDIILSGVVGIILSRVFQKGF